MRPAQGPSLETPVWLQRVADMQRSAPSNFSTSSGSPTTTSCSRAARQTGASCTSGWKQPACRKPRRRPAHAAATSPTYQRHGEGQEAPGEEEAHAKVEGQGEPAYASWRAGFGASGLRQQEKRWQGRPRLQAWGPRPAAQQQHAHPVSCVILRWKRRRRELEGSSLAVLQGFTEVRAHQAA